MPTDNFKRNRIEIHCRIWAALALVALAVVVVKITTMTAMDGVVLGSLVTVGVLNILNGVRP